MFCLMICIALPAQLFELFFQLYFLPCYGSENGLRKLYQYEIAGAKKVGAGDGIFYFFRYSFAMPNRIFLFAVCMLEGDEYEYSHQHYQPVC